MFRQKAVAVAVMFILVFNIISIFSGVLTTVKDETKDQMHYSPEELETYFGKFRGTRAGESQEKDRELEKDEQLS